MTDRTERASDYTLPTELTSFGDPVVAFAADGTIVDWNPALATTAETCGGSVGAAVEFDRDAAQAAVERADEEGAATLAAAVQTDGGDHRGIAFRLSSLPETVDASAVAVGQWTDNDRPDGARPTADRPVDTPGESAATPGNSGYRSLAERERALRRAYDVIAETELEPEEKIDALLGTVRETIGTDFATLSNVRGQEYVVEAFDGAPDVTLEGPDGTPIEEGDSVPLEMTNCERVVETGDTLVLEDIDAASPELSNRAVNVEMGLDCYLGVPVIVDGEPYGTFCFYDSEASDAGFSEWEITFVEWLGSWVSYELERERLLERIRTEERKRYETLVEQSSDGVVVVQDGVYDFVNDRFVELTGYDREELLGRPFESVFAPEYRDGAVERYEQRFGTGDSPDQHDIELRTATGDTRILELAASSIDHDGDPALLATFRDVTERTRRERAVRSLERATRRMQAARTETEIAEIAVDAARDALDLPMVVCWFHDEETELLEPVAGTDPVHDDDRFVALGQEHYEYEVFEEGEPTTYVPRAVDPTNTLGSGVLLPLGTYGLLAAGAPKSTEHDDVVLEVARTLAEHTTAALERIERTHELERTRAYFRALTENTSFAVISIDADNTIQYVNDAVENVLGYDPETLVGDSLLTIMPERFRGGHARGVERYLESGDKQLNWSWIELPGQHRDGHEVPLGISFGEAVVDGEQRFTAVLRDITDQKRTREELREEKAFTESIFAALPDVFYAFDEAGQFLRWNDEFRDVTGYSDEEIATMELTDFIVDSDRETVATAIAEVYESDTTVTVEATLETKAGERIPYEFTSTQLTDEDGTTIGIVGIGRDITDRKRRQRRFEAVFDNTYQFTGLMEPDGTLIEANETALEFGGINREDVIGERVWDADWFNHDEEIQELTKAGVEAAAEGEFFREEITVQGADREAVIDFSIRPITDQDGQVTLLIPEGRDITALKDQERELRRERDHTRQTEQLANVGGWELDFDAETIRWTNGTRRLYDVPDEHDPSFDELEAYIAPEDRDQVLDAIEECRTSGSAFDLDARIVTETGRRRWVRIQGEQATDRDGDVVRGVVQDITERLEREQRLMVLNRVLRHNLRNKLTVVSGYAEQLDAELADLAEPSETAAAMRAEHPEEGRPIDDTIERILDAVASFPVDRSRGHASTVRDDAEDLVSLADKVQQFERTIDAIDVTRSVRLDPVLSELIDGYRERFPDATITVDMTDVTILGDETFVELAVGELIDNALTHGGDDPHVRVSVDRAGKQARITVVDDGPGIPEMERKVLAEGEETSLLHGSGIGLWTVNWLVTRVGGRIGIEDREKGTTVTLFVPTDE